MYHIPDHKIILIYQKTKSLDFFVMYCKNILYPEDLSWSSQL